MAPLAEYDKLEVVTEEVSICKLLTSNDPKVRKKGLSSLKTWFKKMGLKKGLQEDDFNRIWSGLFYYFWMSDKPLVQEEAAEYISGMVHALENYQATMFYVRGFFTSIVKQWDRISHYRIDKFLMLVRRFLRQILILLKNHEWDIEKLELFSTELYNAIQILPYSLALHLNEIFNEEVAKISRGKISTDALIALYKGFFECIVNLRPSMQVVNSIQSSIFGGLARQLKLHIKQKALAEDCDNEIINENAGDDDDEVNTSALDPRPGGVDVFLPFVELDETIFVKFIEQHTSKPIPIKAKNILTQLLAMFKSITKLRTSVSDTDKLIREMQENPKKRKRPKKALSKLIKKSCRQLEEDEEEDEIERDERVLKKLRNLTDLIQIPAGKSTFTVVQAKPKTNELKRTSISDEWTVTKSVEKPSTPKKAKISGSKNDWVVDETPSKISETLDNETSKKSGSFSVQLTPKGNEKLTKTDKKSPVSFSVQEITPEDSEKSTKTNKKSPASFTVQEITPKDTEKSTKMDRKSPASFTVQDISPKDTETSTKTDIISSASFSVQEITPKDNEKSTKMDKTSPASFSVLEITPKDSEKSTKTDKKSPASFSVQEITPKDSAKCTKTNEKSPASFSVLETVSETNEKLGNKSPSVVFEEQSVERNEDDNVPVQKSEIIEEPIENSKEEYNSDSDIELNISSDEGKSFNQPTVILTPISVQTETEKAEFIEKDQATTNSDNSDVQKMNSPSNKPLSVSFSEKPTVSHYEEDSQNCNTENEIVVPASVVKSHPKLMKENKDYLVVDFNPKADEAEKESIDLVPELETITRVLRSRKVESAAVPSTPEKRTRKIREKRSDSATPSRKSTRIAEKQQKKVEFKLEENTYQDVPTYEKVLKSNPASPYDSSKSPTNGILKPFAVTSPINPFYLANGDRKLNRKKRKN